MLKMEVFGSDSSDRTNKLKFKDMFFSIIGYVTISIKVDVPMLRNMSIAPV